MGRMNPAQVVKSSIARDRARMVSRYQQDGNVLRLAAKDSSRLVRTAVARNMFTPTDVLVSFYENDKSTSIREALAKNISTPVSILVELSDDPRKMIWRACFDNHNFPLKEKVDSAKRAGNKQKALYVGRLVSKRRNHIQLAFNYLLTSGWVQDAELFDSIPDETIMAYFLEWLAIPES